MQTIYISYKMCSVSQANQQLDSSITNLKILEKYIQTYYSGIKDSDFITLTDIIYMAAMRNNISIEMLVRDLYKGILNLEKFRSSTSGNIYDFIEPKYVNFAKRVKDITVGSNGGMANVGKGEWLISICSGINPENNIPRVNIIKEGQGDLKYSNSETEEIKWNGGKVSVEKAGNDINRIFKNMINITDKNWVPFRIKDKKIYSVEEIQKFNAIYWNAISEENSIILTDDELMQKIINLAFIKVFNKSNTFIMFNDDGKFQRFYNIDQANLYYKDKLQCLRGSTKGFECRANKPNPIALYCHVF